jgi:hypothetical protein
MAHQWSNEDFCHELEHVAKLLQERPNSMVGHTALGTLKQRLQGVPTWSPSALSDLYGKVKATTLPDPLKEQIMEVMDSLDANNQTNLQLSTKPQSLHNLPPYLTQADWDKLHGGHLMVDGLRVLCERLKALGVKSMKEDTKRECIAVLLHVKCTVQKQAMPNPWQIYYMVNDLVKVFGNTKSEKCQVLGLLAYPALPTSLPQAFLQKAYGNEKPAMEEVSLSYLYAQISLRNTKGLLLEEQNKMNKKRKGPSEASSSTTPGGQDAFVEKLAGFMDKWMDQQTAQALGNTRQHVNASRPVATPMQGSTGKVAEALPLMDQELPVPAPAKAEAQVPALQLEDFEKKAFEHLQKKRVEAKSKSKVMKRPASAKASTQKPDERPDTKAMKGNQAQRDKPQGFGCKRCRGNIRGCSPCRKPGFAGVKFYSRQEWVKWARDNGKK